MVWPTLGSRTAKEQEQEHRENVAAGALYKSISHVSVYPKLNWMNGGLFRTAAKSWIIKLFNENIQKFKNNIKN